MPQSHAEHRKPKLLEQVRRVVRTQRKSIHTIPAAVLYSRRHDLGFSAIKSPVEGCSDASASSSAIGSLSPEPYRHSWKAIQYP